MSNGVLEELEPIWFEREKRARDFAQHVGRPRAVKRICPVIQAARVVEDGEEADDSFIGAGFLAELEAGGFNPLPVVGSVYGVGAAGED
jgi:hypothetical protein